ncbi:MAG: uracil-DNA glycosylase [Mesorhizobium sp.]
MATAALTRAALEELLHFYAESGVDAALEDAPVDRFTTPEPVRAARPSPQPETSDGQNISTQQRIRAAAPPPRPAAAAIVPDEAQAARAREAAKSAATLDELREIVAAFEGCNLKATAKSTVFADGNPAGGLMLVGEAPGREEDIEGLPFVGRSGQLLDKILAAIGIDRTNAYIANVIPWRPPGNRTPTPLETEICRPFIERQIELAAPKVLVTLGGPSAKVILGAQEGVMRLRGKWQVHKTPGGVEIPVMPTLHPAYLLRNPAHKKLVWRDLLQIKARLRQES